MKQVLQLVVMSRLECPIEGAHGNPPIVTENRELNPVLSPWHAYGRRISPLPTDVVAIDRDDLQILEIQE